MDTILGLLGMAIWIIAVMALAAGMTYLVIKLSPGEKPKKPEPESGTPAS